MTQALTLAIDASTYQGTVALISGDRVIATAEVAMRGEREERLMPAIAAALGDAGAGVRDLVRVIAGAGPGSFTSLRIGAALAKGICTAARIPLAAVPSLGLLVAGAERAMPDGRYLAVLDAMRGDMYASLVEAQGGIVISVDDPWLLPRAGVPALASKHGATIVGLGEAVNAAPHARGVARMASVLVRGASLDSWEPAYGRLAEAQVKWEAEHGRPLATG
jgi:tRNA threonylcarbamoyladenosine biosynthesis protein TsaB